MVRPSLREQLVTRSSAVFLERGFNAASVNDIVHAAGVPKGSFYNHFESKEALAIEVLRRHVDTLGLQQLTEPHGSPIQQLRDHLAANIAARIASGIQFGCLLGNFSTDAVALNEGLRQGVADGFSQWIDAVASAISRAQAAGEIENQQDPQTLARFVVASFEGAVAQAKTLRIADPADDFLAVIFSTVLR